MRIVEFLHPLKKKPTRDLCLAALYFADRYNGKGEATIQQLRELLKQARVPKVAKLNLADVLAKSAPYVDTVGKEKGSLLWSLTTTGQQRVRTLLGLPAAEPEIEQDVSSLEAIIHDIGDDEVVKYLREAIKCLSIGALRAAIVFLWAGAISKIRQECMDCGAANVDAALRKHDLKVRKIKKLDDLVYVKEATLLLAAEELSLFDKNERLALTDALNLRNKSGHPGKYSPGPKKASSFIEDVISIVFSD